jgi:predicted phosphate transport protein (TIGR00153 family)
MPSKSASFFDQFEQQAAKIVDGCRLLLTLTLGGDVDVRSHANAIADIEQECDVITHAIVDRLRSSFITPLNRNEIHRLIMSMDEVIDFAEAAAERVALFDLREPSEEASGLARVLLASAECVLEAVSAFRDLKRPKKILDKCGEIARLEAQADGQLRVALARLFREERDPIAILKWKEVYELLETATDRCQDVANVIEGVVIENS